MAKKYVYLNAAIHTGIKVMKMNTFMRFSMMKAVTIQNKVLSNLKVMLKRTLPKLGRSLVKLLEMRKI